MVKRVFGYKILMRSSKKGSLASFIVRGKARILYRKGVPVHAPRWLGDAGYYPTFFATRQQVDRYKGFSTVSKKPPEIWKVEVQDIIFSLLPRLDVYQISYGQRVESFSPWPPGTRMAKTIILREKVETETSHKKET